MEQNRPPGQRRFGAAPCADVGVEVDDDFDPPIRRNDYRYTSLPNPLRNGWVVPNENEPEQWYRFRAQDRVIECVLSDPRPIVPGLHMNVTVSIFQYLFRRAMAQLGLQNRQMSILFRLDGLQFFEENDMDIPQTWFGQLHHRPQRPADVDRAFYCNLYRLWQGFISRQNGAVTRISLAIIDFEEQYLHGNAVPLRENPFEGRRPVVREGDYVNLGNYRTNVVTPGFMDNLQRRERPRDDDDNPGPSNRPARRPRVGGANQRSARSVPIGPFLVTSYNSYRNNCLFVNLTAGIPGFRHSRFEEYDKVRQRLHIPPGKIDFQCIPALANYYGVKVECYDSDGELLVEGGSGEHTVKLLLHEEHYWWIRKEQRQRLKCKECGRRYYTTHECNKARADFWQHRKPKRIGARTSLNRKPSKESPPFNEEQCIYFDMETFMEPSKGYHVPYAIGWYSSAHGYQVSYGPQCMAEFLRYLKENTGKILVAYNGSRFDFHILLRECIDQEFAVSELLFHSGRLLQAKLDDHVLFDLCLFTNCSLASACKNFGVDDTLHKSIFPHRFIDSWEKLSYVGALPPYEIFFYKSPDLISDEDRQAIDAVYPPGTIFDVKSHCLVYLEKDVMGMRQVMQKFADLVEKELHGNLTEYMTLGQLTYSQWKKTLDKEIIFAHDETDYYNIRSAYYGGRVYPVRREFVSEQYDDIKAGRIPYESVTSYLTDQDVNSLYPYVMKEFPYPIGDYVHQVEEYTLKDPFIGVMAICRIEYQPPDTLLHPILPSRTKSGLIWDLTPGSGWYTSVDLNLALEHGYQIHIKESYAWYQSAYIFEDYLKSTIAIKDAGTLEKNPVKRQIGKLLSNSLYGKFAQSPVSKNYKFCANEEDISEFVLQHEPKEFYVLGEKLILTGEKRTGLSIDRPHFIGAFITAYSRKVMYDYFMKANPTQSLDMALYYTDTDSMHMPAACLQHIQEDLDPVTLGKLSNDIKGEGKIIKAYYVAPKLYYMEYITENSTGETIKSKGVNPDFLRSSFFLNYARDYETTVEVDMGLRLKSTGLHEPILQHKNISLSRTLNGNPWQGRRWCEESNVWFPWK